MNRRQLLAIAESLSQNGDKLDKTAAAIGEISSDLGQEAPPRQIMCEGLALFLHSLSHAAACAAELADPTPAGRSIQ